MDFDQISVLIESLMEQLPGSGYVSNLQLDLPRVLYMVVPESRFVAEVLSFNILIPKLTSLASGGILISIELPGVVSGPSTELFELGNLVLEDLRQYQRLFDFES